MYGQYMGGHRDEMIEHQQMLKNIETDGGYNAKVSGDQGELKISSILKSLPDCYHVMDDILLQTKKGSTQLDHVIVSPYGIFVVETKNHKGMIFGDCCGKVWTQVLRGAGHFKMYSPVLQNMGNIRHLSMQTKIPEQFMQGVIVFTNEQADLTNVSCPYCFNVDNLYYYIMQFTNVILPGKSILNVINRIDKVDTNSYMNRQKHIAYVEGLKNKYG